MHIALVTHKVGFQDGQGRVNYEIAKAAMADGRRVTVLGEDCAPEIANHPNGRFVRLLDRALPTQMAKDLYFASRSASWLRQHRGEFDLVQANGFVTWEPADLVAVHFVHSAWLKNDYYPFHWGGMKPSAWYQRTYSVLNSRLEQRAFRSAKKLVAVSRPIADQVAALGIERSRIAVVYNGVDTEEFIPGRASRAAFKLPENVTMVLFVGDIRTPRKNLDSVLKAMQAVPELHLAVAGDVAGSPFPAMARKLGLAGRVYFIGKTRKMALLMRSTDLFVFPSRYEAHPLVLMEAMASGMPVVVSDNFGAQDYVGEGGIVFGGPDDVPALAAAMRQVIADPVRRQQMSRAGRQIALGMQWSDTAAGYLRLYGEMAVEK